MDFITKLLSTSRNHDSIVDRLTKSTHFLPVREDYSMDRLAKLYVNEIVSRHEVPISIISDRDTSQMLRLKLRMGLNDADCQPRMNRCHELNDKYELRCRSKVRKVVSDMHIEEMGRETFRAYELGKWLIALDQRH
ncbi:hypothetical protein E3N88_45775 [Mikania micrantha]|uniref:Uncharacterized protein n=1 Tax=Mikania micrantha TaxID=192012 RepID=A0A5N6L873_9ASTR|nr:hypothetical protein E3N88_45775 [Mikania micrantha]